MPKRKRSRAKSKKKEQPAPALARYLSYCVLILLIIFVIGFSLAYSKNPSGANLAYASIAQSLLFPAIAFAWLFFRGNSTAKIFRDLGLSRDKFTLLNIGVGLLLFFVIILFFIALSLLSTATNIPLPSNVAQTFAGVPTFFLLFTFIIAPINEEILFRGFMVPRFGVVISAVVFAILHLGYLSISEFVSAFVFGLLAGYVFKKRKSLYSSILAHMLVNAITATALIFGSGMIIHLLA